MVSSFTDYLLSLAVTIWSSQMANKTVTSCSNKKGVRAVNKLLAKSRWMMHVRYMIYVREDSKCHVNPLWHTWVWNGFQSEHQELLDWHGRITLEINLREGKKTFRSLKIWEWRLLSTHQLHFHFGPSMMCFLFSSFPGGTVRLTFSFSDPFFFISCKEGFCSAFNIASSWTRRLFVSSMIHFFCPNPEVQWRIGCTLSSVAPFLRELIRGSRSWGPWSQSTILAD